MGVLGTGAAAGVAQVGLQAQQVARQQAKQVADRAYVLQRHKEVRETRLKGLEEDDAAEAETALHVDGVLSDPDRHPDTSPNGGKHHHHQDQQADSDADVGEGEADASDEASVEGLTYASPLQRKHRTPPAVQHRLDVKA
ncbi:hypothetical protein ACERK3_16615 [Phycisphaerales bacterium AB-hyl4]|uniref:Uncharacterized protein n=1 Tax=Natronomicrosphaera hydrolytica TaxID=3242702 RepID=A0ABV4U8I6_9BACT